MSSQGNTRLRVVLLIVSVVLSMGSSIVVALSFYSSPSGASIPRVPYNKLTQFAAEQRIEASRSLFHVNLLVIAAIWGFVIASKGEVKLITSNGCVLTMFILSNLCLLASCFAHTGLMQTISTFYLDAGRFQASSNLGQGALQECSEPPEMVDIFEGGPMLLYWMQWWFLIPGIAIAAMATIVLHWSKENET